MSSSEGSDNGVVTPEDCFVRICMEFVERDLTFTVPVDGKCPADEAFDHCVHQAIRQMAEDTGFSTDDLQANIVELTGMTVEDWAAKMLGGEPVISITTAPGKGLLEKCKAMSEVMTEVITGDQGKEMAALKDSVTALKTKIAELEKKVTELEQNATNLQQQLFQLRADKQALHGQVKDVLQVNQELEAEKSKLEKNGMELEKKLLQLGTDKQAWLVDNHALQNQVTELQKEVVQVKSELEEEKSELEAEKSGLEAEKLELQAEKLQLQARVQQLQSEVHQLRTQVSHLNAAVMQLQMTNIGLQNRVGDIQGYIMDLRNEVVEMRSENREMRARLTVLETAHGGLP